MSDLSQRLRRLRPGTEVEFRYRAFIIEHPVSDGDSTNEAEPPWVALSRPGVHQPWFETLTDGLEIEIIPPNVIPGTIISAGGVLWVVRKSNPTDSFRVMPVDLSGKLRTLPIEEFYERFPAAKIKYDPRESTA